jgi:hypothetical protein
MAMNFIFEAATKMHQLLTDQKYFTSRVRSKIVAKLSLL